MPATPERMMLVQAEFRTVAAGPDSTVASKYGDSARDNGDDLIETFFHSVEDAAVFCGERLTLLKRDASRLEMIAQGHQTGVDIALGNTVQTASVIDQERDLDRPMIIANVRISGSREATTISVWG